MKTRKEASEITRQHAIYHGRDPDKEEEKFVYLPCNCEEDDNVHWVRVRMDKDAIIDHLTLYWPYGED